MVDFQNKYGDMVARSTGSDQDPVDAGGGTTGAERQTMHT